MNQIDNSALERKIDKPLIWWLLIVCALTFFMIFVGGITRLTDSGLSMVEWKPITGFIPPLSEEAWEIEFDKYKNYPEFQIINHQMALHEFKKIYFWEYFHRVIGRLIGIVFFFPYLYFVLRKRVDKVLNKKLLVAFCLGGLQGFMGWYMVTSGLVDKPDVSHYRLAAHLVLAFVIISYIFWIIFDEYNKGRAIRYKNKAYWAWALLALILFQITYGAFTAGLKAGLGYNTFPLMDGKLYPDEMFYLEPLWINFLENNAGVQFVHRTFGWIVLFAVVAFGMKYYEGSASKQAWAIRAMLIAVVAQFLLGVLTLLFHVPISLASLHQIGALILCLFAVYNVYVQRLDLRS